MRQIGDKFVTLEKLKWMRGILCHGCYDVLHIGHIRHLLAARALDAKLPLIVTVTADAFIQKGPGRPCFKEDVRAECLASLECVDFVAVVQEATGLTSIRGIQPKFYVKGIEYKGIGGIAEMERLEAERLGGVVHYTERFHSSTSILERLNG